MDFEGAWELVGEGPKTGSKLLDTDPLCLGRSLGVQTTWFVHSCGSVDPM